MRQTILVFAVMLLVSPSLAISQCARKVAMATYSACFPNDWQVFTDTGLDQVSGCNKKQGSCTGTGGGFPLKGVVFIFLTPAEKVPYQKYHDVEDIVASAPHAGEPAPPVSEVNFGDENGKRKCLVARRLLSPALGFWDEIYGLEVDGRLFRVWVQYQDEDRPEKIEAYRSAVKQILSSVSVDQSKPHRR
jgi:hypothetical protein